MFPFANRFSTMKGICAGFIASLTLLSVSNGDKLKKERTKTFPIYFRFGVGTSAYQVEGAWNEAGKAPSIWDTMTHKRPSVIDDRSNGDIAADSYHNMQRDVQMMKELGIYFYRFSISWPRVLPNGFTDKINPDGIKYYNDLINLLISNSIEPFITLYHWDLPQNLQNLGGFANPYIVDWFADYANLMFEEFGDRVKWWVTINEPKQICVEGYGGDAKAPMYNQSGIAEYYCAKHVLLAHAKVYHLYDKVFRKRYQGKVGISISCTWYEPVSANAEDKKAAKDAREFDWGIYAHPIFSNNGDFPQAVRDNVNTNSAEQNYPRSRLPKMTTAEVTLVRGASDFFGVNHYSTKMAYRDASLEGMYAVPSYMDDMSAVLITDPSWPQAKSSWLQEVPWGFYKLLTEIRYQYNNPPVIITENGWSTSGGLIDDDRIRYMRSYLSAMLNAIEAGSNITMYCAWSLMDNFEWKRGYTEKFGLYEVDFDSFSRVRTPRKSAFVYKHITETRTLDQHYNPNYQPYGGRQSSTL